MAVEVMDYFNFSNCSSLDDIWDILHVPVEKFMIRDSQIPYIERALGLPQGTLLDPALKNRPETVALLQLVDLFPWLAEVSDRGFEPKAAALIMQREAAILQLKELDDQ